MYKNYIFDLYGTLIDINTDEWSAKLWKSLQILYAYHGAEYTPQEIKREYGRLVDKEKASVRRRHPRIYRYRREDREGFPRAVHPEGR